MAKTFLGFCAAGRKEIVSDRESFIKSIKIFVDSLNKLLNSRGLSLKQKRMLDDQINALDSIITFSAFECGKEHQFGLIELRIGEIKTIFISLKEQFGDLLEDFVFPCVQQMELLYLMEYLVYITQNRDEFSELRMFSNDIEELYSRKSNGKSINSHIILMKPEFDRLYGLNHDIFVDSVKFPEQSS